MTNRVVKVILRGEVGDLAAKLKVAQASVQQTTDRMTGATKEAREFRSGLSTIGSTATKAGLVTAAGIGLITKAAIDWDSAWAGVTKTVDGTPAQLSAIESGLRAMSRTLPTSATELASIAEAAGALGVQTDSILQFTRVAAGLGETTNLSSEDAATGLSQLMNVMQTAPQDIGRLGSTLVALGNNGASTERQILEMAQQIAGAGEIVGASESDVLALSNALASVGIDAEAGGTAVSKVLIDMSKAISTNSADLSKFASVAGQTTAEFAANFKDAPVAAFDDFTKGLGRINAEGGDVFTILSDLGQSDVRVTRALLGMANSGNLLADSLALGSTEWERNSALAEEAAKRYDTAASKGKIALNGIKDNAIDAGNAILPVFASAAEGVSNLADGFGRLPGPIKSSVGIIGTVGGAGLLAVAGIAKLLDTVSSTRDALQKLGTTAPRTAGALGKIGKIAGTAAVAMTALNIASKFQDSDVASVEKFTGALIDLGDGSSKSLEGLASSNMGLLDEQLGGVAAALAEVNANSKGAGKLGSEIAGALSFGGFQDNKSANSIKALDDALTSLVMSGAPEKAAEGFDYIAGRADLVGVSAKNLQKLFPGYTATLDDAANKSKLAGEGADVLGTGLDGVGGAASGAASEVDQLNDSLNALLDPLLSQEDASNAWKDSIASLTAELKENGGGLDDNSAKGRKNQDAIRERVKALKESAQADFDAGGTAEEMSAKLLRGARSIIKTAEAAGIGKGEVRKYLKELGLSPTQIKTALNIEDNATPTVRKVVKGVRNLDSMAANPTINVTDNATGKIRAIQQYIDGMHGKTVKVKVEGGTPGGQTTNANGSITDYYANGGMRENHIAQIAPAGAMRVWAEPETGGEAYIPFAQSKRKRSQEIAMQTVSRLGGVASFADGGTTGGSTSVDLVATGIAPAIGAAVKNALFGTTFQILPDGSVRAKEMGA